MTTTERGERATAARPGLRVTRMDVLLAWHGLFAGSWVVAYVSGGDSTVHQFAGYTAFALLVVRLVAANVAAEKSVWRLPWPSVAMWKPFLRKLSTGDLSAWRNRTPLAPLSGLLMLAAMVVTVPTGLMADWWDVDDLHEGIAEATLSLVAVHVAIVALGPLLKRLTRRGHASSR